MRVLIVGDIHGNVRHFAGIVEAAATNLGVEAVIQVGDFGFFPGFMGSKNLHFAVPVFAIDGNHEDHYWLRAAAAQTWPHKYNLTYQCRGSVREIGGRRVGFLGGALHVDRPQTGLLSPLDPANWIRPADVKTACREFGPTPLDLVVTHTCPAAIGVGMRGSPVFEPGVEVFVRQQGFDPGPKNDVGDMALTDLWHSIPKPPLWVFGHFHQHRTVTVKTTEFHCVGSGDGNGPFKVVLWDTETGELEHG